MHDGGCFAGGRHGGQFDLERFERAQAPVYDAVLDELRAGRKRSHWMWFIFPQLAGLGRSEMAQRYAISSLDEAAAYLAHPVLGARLRECAALVLAVRWRLGRRDLRPPGQHEVPFVDDAVRRSARADPVFRECLDKYFGGAPDALTLARLKE